MKKPTKKSPAKRAERKAGRERTKGFALINYFNGLFIQAHYSRFALETLKKTHEHVILPTCEIVPCTITYKLPRRNKK